MEITNTEITTKQAISEAIKIFQEKAQALAVAEKMLRWTVCPPAARRDAWRRRRYLAYVEKLQALNKSIDDE